ncbi:MAG: hypothetical protein KKG60_02565 [Nanoarchaeota archaeon]|nr:hypothetical protein [Nanoarchaeota archaeon]
METLKAILKVILGFVVLVLGVYAIISWSGSVWITLKAAIALGVTLIGLAFIIIGTSDMKNT